MEKKLNKRGIGAIEMIASAAILVLIAIITVSIGISVNDNLTDSLIGDPTPIVNEALAADTNVTLAILTTTEDVINATASTSIIVYNPHANVTLQKSEYRFSASEASINITNKTVGGNISWINYSYTAHPEAYNASAAGTTGLSAFGDYWTSIVSIIILVVIVGLFAYFRGGTGGIEVR